MRRAPRDVDELLAAIDLELGVDVDDLELEVLDVGGVEYMRRYYLHRAPQWSVRLHLIVADDPGTALHDHPWAYTSLLLAGGYLEHTVDGAAAYQAPAVLHRDARQAHRLELIDGPALTYVATGPVVRRWGFHTPTGWVPYTEYDGAGSYR